ncbi:hypothetical protein [Lysobacter sp. ISL-52]|uniref:hypothetical protein n=1 Tax=Lysobacter sp. ISL-52 TaxID=2819154 RepID=UPI001BE5FB92|nr:hypothetical protein [Lysobacter sp. ISL-52]MBT2781391.1 hypothetical protein [Lysobacter sp. ISL-52]
MRTNVEECSAPSATIRYRIEAAMFAARSQPTRPRARRPIITIRQCMRDVHAMHAIAVLPAHAMWVSAALRFFPAGQASFVSLSKT